MEDLNIFAEARRLYDGNGERADQRVYKLDGPIKIVLRYSNPKSKDIAEKVQKEFPQLDITVVPIPENENG